MPGRGYEEYLTEQDWRRLQTEHYAEGDALSVQLLGKAAEALGLGEVAQAFVNVISALEAALVSRIRATAEHKKLRSALNSFAESETLPARTAVVLLAIGVDPASIECVLEAIRVRNAVVHDGYKPKGGEGATLRGVMQSIKTC